MTVTNAEQPGEIDQSATTEQVEGEIRAFVRRDVSVFRRPRVENGNEMSIDGINSLMDRVAGASVAEIERVIAELTRVRDMLRHEGERVQREINSYAVAEPGHDDLDEDHRRQPGTLENSDFAVRSKQRLTAAPRIALWICRPSGRFSMARDGSAGPSLVARPMRLARALASRSKFASVSKGFPNTKTVVNPPQLQKTCGKVLSFKSAWGRI